MHIYFVKIVVKLIKIRQSVLYLNYLGGIMAITQQKKFVTKLQLILSIFLLTDALIILIVIALAGE